MTDRQLRAQEPTAPLGWPRRETEFERKTRIDKDIIGQLVEAGFSQREARDIVDTIAQGIVPRLSIDYEFGDDDTI